MTRHEDRPFADHLVGDGNGLFRIAFVIGDFQNQLLAVDAT